MMHLSYRKIVYAFLVCSTVLIAAYSYFVLNDKNLYMNREYPMWELVKSFIQHNHDNKYNFYCIGDSRAKAGFIPDVFDFDDIRSYNLSLGGSTPIEGYYTLKIFLDHNPPPRYLLMSFAPYHFETLEAIWGRTVRFGFINYDQFNEIRKSANMVGDTDDVDRFDYFSYKYRVGRYLTELQHGIMQKRWRENSDVYLQLQQSRGHYYFGRNSKSHAFDEESARGHFIVSKLINYYFEKTMRLANENNITVFYFTMPLNMTSFLHLQDDYKQSYDRYISSLRRKYGFIQLDELIDASDACFGDPSHLYKGAKSVSKHLQTDIKNCLQGHECMVDKSVELANTCP